MDNGEEDRPRIPPNQVVTQKFPLMTAGDSAHGLQGGVVTYS